MSCELSQAAIFRAGVISVTDAIIAPPPLLTPNLTRNSAARPIAVVRVAWI